MKIRWLGVWIVLFAVGACKKSAPLPPDEPSDTRTAAAATRKVDPERQTAVADPADEQNQRGRPRERPPRQEKPPEPKYPAAKIVPGKPGYVFSPYNDRVVDVRELPPGALVADPTFPASEQKYFRVP